MNIWVAIYRMSWVLIIGMIVVALVKLWTPKWKEMQEYRRRQQELAREIALEEEMIQLLRRKQERFRTDPAFVERLAHDLGLARSNEILVRVITEPATAAPPIRAERAAPTPPRRPPRQ